MPTAEQSEILDTKYQDGGCSVVLVTCRPLINWKVATWWPCELISTVFIDILAQLIVLMVNLKWFVLNKYQDCCGSVILITSDLLIH